MTAASYKLTEPDATAGEAEVALYVSSYEKSMKSSSLGSVSVVIGFLMGAQTGERGAISLTPWLQPGDQVLQK